MKKKSILLIPAIAMCLAMTGCGQKGDIENEKAYRQIGINNMTEGAYEDAIVAFDKALSLSGGQIRNIEYDICYRKIDAFTALGDTDSAKELCDYLIKYDKNVSVVYVLRGNLYLKGSDPELALKDFETAVAKDPDNVANYIAIYTGLSNAGFDVQAQEYVDKALKVEGSADDEQFVRSMAKLYYIRGEYDTAVSYLRTMDDPDDQSMYYMGNIHMDSGAYSEAIDDYSKAIELYEKSDESFMSPTDIKAMYRNRIIAKELIYDFTGASKLMEEYVEKYPDDAAAAREAVFLATRRAESEYTEESETQTQSESTTETSGTVDETSGTESAESSASDDSTDTSGTEGTGDGDIVENSVINLQ